MPHPGELNTCFPFAVLSADTQPDSPPGGYAPYPPAQLLMQTALAGSNLFDAVLRSHGRAKRIVLPEIRALGWYHRRLEVVL